METAIHLVSNSSRVELDIDVSTTVNFAMHQNDVAVVRRLRIQNHDENELLDVTVSLTAEPEFAHPWQRRIERLPGQSTHDLGVVDIPLSPKFLAAQTEAVRGYLNAHVRAADQVLQERRLPIEVLAYDQWNGLRSFPELLAAFVMPNHSVVEQILRQAAEILNNWTGDSALTGYQSRSPERARLQTAAIYEAVRRHGIAYSGVPASFEENGQKVRTPDRILEARIGNCLDLSVLLAACLEQSDLHPLIFLIEGHAFGGAWLIDDAFPDPAVDDPTAITKREALGEVCVFEATAVTADESFEVAERAARRHFENLDHFVCAIDVRRARTSHIRPIPMRRAAGEGDVEIVVDTTPPPPSPGEVGSNTPVRTVDPGETQQAESQPDTSENGKTQASDRLEQWKRKLLDLSLRNALLNFRETKRTVPILSSNLSDLENALAEGRKLAIHAMPADWEKSERDPSLFLQRTGDDAVRELLLSEFEKGRLRAALGETELQRRLIEIYRTARSSLEENGANTLYLSLGNLLWYETHSPSAPERRAPLLLVPIEIQRKSVQAPFTIELRDDDAAFNITLLEMLRSNFGLEISGLDPLPQDDAGIDVPTVFRLLRQSIKHMPRWDLEERAYIGHYSFTKFLMWRDLVNRTEDLKRNKLVASLINFPHQPLPVSSPIPDEHTLDDVYKPADTFSPLSADSSQLAAVYAAAEGNTFVLHGPPGTGKSQTITNMIAQALGQGKTVLFVAEKMAALNVVQRRLADNGLGEFCLELHSNKSKKSDVVRQLGDTLHLAQTQEPAEWTREADRFARLRAELNAYVSALHRPRSSGDSYFTGISQLIKYRTAPNVKLDRTWAASATPDKLSTWRERVNALAQAGQAVGHPSGHAWSGAEVQEWSADLRDDVQESIEKGKRVIAESLQAVGPVSELFRLPTAPLKTSQWDSLRELTELVLTAPHRPAGLVAEGDWEDAQSALELWIRVGRERDQLRSELYDRFNEKLIQLDLERMTAEYEEASTKWFLSKMLTQRRIVKELQAAANPGVKVDAGKIDQLLSRATQLRGLEVELSKSGDRARRLLGGLWADGEADWDAVQAGWNWASAVRQLAAKLAGSDLKLRQALRERWATVFAEASDGFGDGGVYSEQLRAFRNLASDLESVTNRLTALLNLNPVSRWVAGENDDYLSMLETTLDQWGGHLGDLRLWCVWQKLRAQSITEGLEPIVVAYEVGLPHDQVVPCFERSYYESWTDVVMGEDEILRNFSRHTHEEKIREFKDLDDRFRDLTKQVLRARLLARVPQQVGTPSGNSEMGILRREVQKKTRHMPIRTLFNGTPNLLTRLKPCLLMSPISVAQYLDASFPPFDLVIFDEASQIPTWDAVGAVARGSETIIVGDPKQLPPTSFFDRADSSDDDDSDTETIKDLESILDDCLALNIQEHFLKWHYRSRHEALIAFSNAEYYNNELNTFPSPAIEPAVRLGYVNGVYDRGSSKTNRIEAGSVVDEVIRRLTDPTQANLSIGIVTFNSAQQRLIEDLLDEACRRHPEIEPYFSTDVLEPVFVKNLENVQGDERDVILFSVGYGPDKTGRVSMNFGPLNRAGGERRLNVAITRARQEVQVFSSLQPDQIDLGRTQQRGVKDLKTFLEYAQQGPIALDRKLTLSSNTEAESPFEQDVMDALVARGYDVVPQVGCSGYRIDLAVVDPKRLGRFVLGIECDGAMYHSAKNARDRDKLREGVLRDLGWEIHRIWSTDWWDDQEGEMERLETAIHEAMTKAKDDPPVPAMQPSSKADVNPEPKIASAPNLSGESKSEPALKYSPNFPVYTLSTVSPERAALAHNLYSYQATPVLRGIIEQIVTEEGPITLNLVTRRIANWWGVGRVTSRALKRIEDVVASSRVKKVTHDGVKFLWPHDADPATYDTFRLPGEGDTRRDAQDLPPEEIANALLYVVRSQVALPRDDLVREGARLLGYQRTGNVVERSMLAGLELLEARGAVREVNGMVVEA